MGLLSGVEEVVAQASEYPDNAMHPGRVVEARAMWEWARYRGLDIRELAIQFCLAAPVQGIVLSGAATTKQVEETCKAATAEIPPGIWPEFKAEFGI